MGDVENHKFPVGLALTKALNYPRLSALGFGTCLCGKGFVKGLNQKDNLQEP